MRRSLIAWFVLHGTSCLSAQDAPPSAEALAAGKQRLAAALQKTASLNDVAFTATWGSDRPKRPDDDGFAAMFGVTSSGKVTGSWHAGLQHCSFEGGNEDELWRTSQGTIARDKDRDWCMRRNRFADGNPISFAADVAALLRALATMDLAVVQRAPGSLDDRPVEIVTVALNPDQVTELARGEHVPEAILTSGMPALQIALGGGRQQRAEAQKPTSTVDLAIAIDPGTSLVHELRFRSWTRNDGNGRNFVVRGGVGAVRVVKADAATDEEDDAEPANGKVGAAAPMRYENGLPVRPRKKTTVMDFAVRLSEHATKQPPTLADDAKKLLDGR